MSDDFQYDVFLAHSPEDESVAVELEKRLSNDWLNVCLDEWSDPIGDDLRLGVEEGVERSRVLVLLMSSSSFDSEWGRLERLTTLFRDPTDETRRFIPLLIKDCEIPEVIRRYKYIDWRTKSDKGYQLLLEACRVRAKQIVLTDLAKIAELKDEIIGHTEPVWSVGLSPDGKLVISGSADATVKIQNLKSGDWQATIRGHSDSVYYAVMLADGSHVLSASYDGTLRLWDLESEECVHSFRGHKSSVNSVALTPDQNYAVSASSDGTLKLWNLRTRKCVLTIKESIENFFAVALTPDGKRALTGSDDPSLKLWNLETGTRVAKLKGHVAEVNAVVITADGARALSASEDATLKLWDLEAEKCLATLEGHQDSVHSVALSPNNRIAASASNDGTIKIWDIESGACYQTLSGRNEAPSSSRFTNYTCVAFNPSGSLLLAGTEHGAIYVYHINDVSASVSLGVAPEVRYTNAKVVLLGESGVGKSGLGYRLAEDRWVVTESTHGMRIWSLKLASAQQRPDVEREVWLWDLAGQPDYRLIHQLFLDETSLALLLFNPQANDPFEGIGDWERALRTATGRDPVKLLIAARIDVGGATITHDKIKRLCIERGFAEYFATSAKLDSDKGCASLKQSLMRYIPWEELPWISTTKLFKGLKDAIVRLKDDDLTLARFSELRQRLQLTASDYQFKEEDLRAVIGLLAGQGIIKRLDFGDFILLQPEQLNNYAAAVIRAAREHVDGIGCIGEREVLEGQFDFRGMPRLRKADEEILLRAMAQSFLEQSLCIREETSFGVQLAFPSQFNREIDIPTHPNIFISYRFSGHLSTIYTTLVVRLTYSEAFEKKDLWKNAAEFFTPEGKIVGLVMKSIAEGVGEIKIFFETGVPDDTRVTFIKYVHEHLLKRATDVERERAYACLKCGKPVKDREAIKLRQDTGKRDIVCVYCDARIPLIDLIERKFNQDRFLKRVQRLDAEAKINLDNESRELILVGQATTTAAEAGQIYRGYTNSDHGIDGEIEFKDERGRASGRKIYLQLKSGDSYLYKRSRDEQEVFTVKKEQHLAYWQSQGYPVYLVIRTSDGLIRWMNITEYLQQRQDKTSKQIIFEGEPFTAQSLLSLRDELFSEYDEC